MKMKHGYSILIMLLLVVMTSCESEVEKQQRLERAYKLKLEREEKRQEEAKEKAIYDKYVHNSLNTGATPYAYCFGGNSSCDDYGCSQLKVKTPYNSDVLVTIKKGNEVVRHAYINGGSSYTFEMPNGLYQPFFYYGKGWNPTKVMKKADCGTLKGGFMAEESFGKDSPQLLNNTILEYELILQDQGNFSTRPSNSDEAF
jgi:hypothetical protein